MRFLNYFRIRRIASAVLFILIAAFVFTRPAVSIQSADTHSIATTVPSEIDPSMWYPVTKVVDGDTIKINKDGTEVTIRFIGVDTPETVDPRKTVQCFGQEASDKTKQILQGQSVRIVSDPSQGMYDKYGRLLAYVYAPLNVRQEGLLMNEYLIAEGYGHEYTYNVPYKYQSEFKAAQKQAQLEKRGLWADAACAAESARRTTD